MAASMTRVIMQPAIQRERIDHHCDRVHLRANALKEMEDPATVIQAAIQDAPRMELLEGPDHITTQLETFMLIRAPEEPDIQQVMDHRVSREREPGRNNPNGPEPTPGTRGSRTPLPRRERNPAPPEPPGDGDDSTTRRTHTKERNQRMTDRIRSATLESGVTVREDPESTGYQFRLECTLDGETCTLHFRPGAGDWNNITGRQGDVWFIHAQDGRTRAWSKLQDAVGEAEKLLLNTREEKRLKELRKQEKENGHRKAMGEAQNQLDRFFTRKEASKTEER